VGDMAFHHASAGQSCWLLAAAVLCSCYLSIAQGHPVCFAADAPPAANLGCKVEIPAADSLNFTDTTPAWIRSEDKKSLGVRWALPRTYFAAPISAAPNATLPARRTGASLYPNVTVHCGATIEVAWAGPMHDLWLVNNEADAECTTDAAPIPKLPVTWAESATRKNLIPRRTSATLSNFASSACISKLHVDGDYWLACSVGNHCGNGMKLKVTVQGCPKKHRHHRKWWQ
jgi:hypothetical protein